MLSSKEKDELIVRLLEEGKTNKEILNKSPCFVFKSN